jgi:hypothetical protein
MAPIQKVLGISVYSMIQQIWMTTPIFRGLVPGPETMEDAVDHSSEFPHTLMAGIMRDLEVNSATHLVGNILCQLGG